MKVNQEAKMAIASDLLQRHFETLVADNAQWQTLIADEILWELPYAPAVGSPGAPVADTRGQVIGVASSMLSRHHGMVPR
jgi:hypothetical protein